MTETACIHPEGQMSSNEEVIVCFACGTTWPNRTDAQQQVRLAKLALLERLIDRVIAIPSARRMLLRGDVLDIIHDEIKRVS